ncbi:MAG: acyl carrier protein [Rhodocyclaceae bacterium]
METLEQIREYIGKKVGTPAEQIVPEATLDAIGVDSLMLLDLMFDFEDMLKIKLPNDLPRPETVAELIAVFDQYNKPAQDA